MSGQADLFPDSPVMAARSGEDGSALRTSTEQASRLAADVPPPPSGSSAAFSYKREMVAKMMRLAAEPLPVEDRLLSMAQVRQAWSDVLPDHPGFVAAVYETAEKIITGQMSMADGTRYLDTLRGGE